MQGSEPACTPEGDEPTTRLYLLRLWREAAGAPWRAALHPAGGAAPRGFAGLGQLAAYLLELAGKGEAPAEAAGEQGAEHS